MPESGDGSPLWALPRPVPGQLPGVRALGQRGQVTGSASLFVTPALSLALGYARGDASGDHGAMCHGL